MRTLLLCLSSLFFSVTCSDPRNNFKLRLINTADRPVLVYYDTDADVIISHSYQVNGIPPYNAFHEFQEADTTRGYQLGLMRDNPNYIDPGGTIYARLGQGSWEGHIGDSKLRIYLFDPSVVLANDWNKLWTGKKWSKSYSFTLGQVKARDWVIRL